MIDDDDVIEQAARNLRRAADSARLVETFALIGLIVGLLGTGAAFLSVFSDDSGTGIVVGLWLALATGTTYAVLRGLASIVTLMVDRVLIEADADDE